MSSGEQTVQPLKMEAPSTDHSSAKGFKLSKQQKMAWLDIKEGVGAWQIWLMLAYQDIKVRYRRSILGPFWITLSMAITVYSMGYLYAHLFRIELAHYYPFLVAGMLSWSLISTLVLECSDGLLNSHDLIKQVKLPYNLHMHRIAARNLLIFFHNALVMIPVYFIFSAGARINGFTLLLLPGLALIYVNALSFGMILAMISARYRDMSQVIKSIVQVVFFITPVMWQPNVLLGKKHLIADLNPFYAFLELVRQPLLGQTPNLENIIVALILTLLGFAIYFWMFSKYRARLVYWL